jgi:ribose transport system ATP-binding protein
MSADLRSRREPPALAARAVSKTFSGTVALNGLDLTIQAGEIRALLGENGSGKSTAIKILSGYHVPDPGAEINVGGMELELGSPSASYALGCRFVHQDLGLIDSASVADNLAFVSGFPRRWASVRERVLRARAREDLERVGLDLDPGVAVGALSPAERTGVAVARALRRDAEHPVALLVLDEPTATLPESEVNRLLDVVRRVAANGVGVLYVTHRLEEVFQVADRITVLRDGHRVADVPVLEIDRPGLVGLLVGSEFADARAASDDLPPERSEPVLVATDVASTSLAGVSLELHPGDVIGIAGITGSGRDSLLPVLFGATPSLGGSLRLGPSGRPRTAWTPMDSMRAGVAYIPADRKTHGIFLDLTTRENVTISDLRRIWRWPLLSPSRDRAEAATWVDRLGVRPLGSLNTPVSSLSGGNQQKVVFAKWLRRSPQVLLLDEPTQGVDIGAKADLHMEILNAARGGAAVAISSADNDELAAVCHRVLVLKQGRVVANLTGASVTPGEISRACLGADEGVRA